MPKVYLAYETSFPVLAATDLVNSYRGTVTLTLSEKVNAGYDVGSFALGQAFPVGNAPAPHAAGVTPEAPKTVDELITFLDKHVAKGHQARIAAAVDWWSVFQMVVALLQALKAAGG